MEYEGAAKWAIASSDGKLTCQVDVHLYESPLHRVAISAENLSDTFGKGRGMIRLDER